MTLVAVQSSAGGCRRVGRSGREGPFVASSWTGQIRSLALLRLFGRNTELGVRQHSAVWNTRAHAIGDPCRRGFLETPSPRHAGTEFTLVALGLAPVPCQPGPRTRPTKEMNLPRPAHTRPPSPLCPGTRPPSHRGGARPPVEDSDFLGALGEGRVGGSRTRRVGQHEEPLGVGPVTVGHSGVRAL